MHWLAMLLVVGSLAHAGDVAPDQEAQLVGLFMQGCMPFAGDVTALRAWAIGIRMPALSDTAGRVFLHGAPGRVFDASVPETKLVLVSPDDGLCSVVTDHAMAGTITRSLESGFRQAGVAFRLAIDRDDTAAKALHFREYLATRNGRGWRVLAATVNDPGGGQAMLTAAPE